MKGHKMSTTNESKGKSLISRRWKLDVKETVNNFNFKLNHVHGDTGKCDFCGNNLVYVAVIDGEATLTLAHAEESNELTHRYTDVMIKEGERWLISDTRAYGLMESPRSVQGENLD